MFVAFLSWLRDSVSESGLRKRHINDTLNIQDS